MTGKQLDTICNDLLMRGFDNTYVSGQDSVKPKCSECEAIVINGTACHEHGCPNAVHECKGCNELIQLRWKYCNECMGLND